MHQIIPELVRPSSHILAHLFASTADLTITKAARIRSPNLLARTKLLNKLKINGIQISVSPKHKGPNSQASIVQEIIIMITIGMVNSGSNEIINDDAAQWWCLTASLCNGFMLSEMSSPDSDGNAADNSNVASKGPLRHAISVDSTDRIEESNRVDKCFNNMNARNATSGVRSSDWSSSLFVSQWR